MLQGGGWVLQQRNENASMIDYPKKKMILEIIKRRRFKNRLLLIRARPDDYSSHETTYVDVAMSIPWLFRV